MPSARRVRSGGVLLFGRLGVTGENFGELVGARDHGGGVETAGLAGQALDRSRDGDSCDDSSGGGTDRGGDRGDAGFALAHALGPTAPAHTGESGGVEGGTLQAAVEPVGLLPGQEDLGSRAGEHRQAGTDGDRVAQAHGPLGG